MKFHKVDTSNSKMCTVHFWGLIFCLAVPVLTTIVSLDIGTKRVDTAYRQLSSQIIMFPTSTCYERGRDMLCLVEIMLASA